MLFPFFFLATIAAAVARSEQLPTEHVTPHDPRSARPDRIQVAQAPLRQGAIQNPANVSIELIPGGALAIGKRVSFRVTTKKPGYVLVIDVDPTGKMSQIFPSPELLARAGDAALNLVTSGQPLLIPNEAARKQGVQYVVTPPTGTASVVAILSDKRVQIVDLPDMATPTKTPDEQLASLQKWMTDLRIPDARTGKLLPSAWSFDQKTYTITAE